MTTKIPFPAVFLAVLALAFAPMLPAASFGPGRAQMIPGGGGEIVLDAPAKQVALRFVAERDGPLTSVRFASRVGLGWTAPTPKLFTVALYDDNAGKPGRQVAVAADIPSSYPGPRAREAIFRNVTLKAGVAYHVVIAMPGSDATKQLSVNYYLFDARSEPFNSYDMETPAVGGDVLVSTDGGAAWAPAAKGAVGSLLLTVGGRLQGWAYTNGYDARIWHAPTGERQALMQRFKFTTAGKGASAKVDVIRFPLRAQGGLGGLSVPVRVRLLEDGKPVASVTLSVTTEAASRFFQVETPLQDVVLKEGTTYVLSIDLPEPAGASASDYLFIRTLAWGFGDPGLADGTWQGTECSMIQAPGEDPATSTPVPKVDLPFVIDYTPVR